MVLIVKESVDSFVKLSIPRKAPGPNDSNVEIETTINQFYRLRYSSDITFKV